PSDLDLQWPHCQARRMGISRLRQLDDWHFEDRGGEKSLPPHQCAEEIAVGLLRGPSWPPWFTFSMAVRKSYTSPAMPVIICMLRGVNLGGHHKIKMDALRVLCESLKFEDPRTYVQSGNVIFRTKEKNSAALAKKIQKAIEGTFGFAPEVLLR